MKFEMGLLLKSSNKHSDIVIYGIFTLFFIPISEQAFLGGSISWLKWPVGDKIKFTYRLTWEKNTGPCGQNCSSDGLYKLGQVPSLLSSLQWQCISGCNSNENLSDINTNLTSVSNKTPGWEQGEQYFFHKNPATRFTVRLDDIPWAVPASGQGRLVTTIDLRTRNDSNLPNASPVAAVPPTLGIPFGCPTTIIIPVEDPDADDIRARVAYADECGGACTSLPKFILKPTLGQLIIDATSKNGYVAGSSYRVTLMIEDFPTYTIKVGNETVTPRHSISKVPLQFTVEVIDDSNGCSDNDMTFAWPTLPDGFRVSYPGFPIVGSFKNGVYLESLKANSKEFMASVPGGMSVEELPDDRGRLNVSRVYASWNPLQDQSGDNILCVWGMKPDRVTTDTRCVVGLINDIDECAAKKVICKNNGTCVNLWHRATCKCPHGFKPKDCTERVTCLDFPCKNNGTCIDTGNEFICLCAPGYTGVDCQTEVDECASRPCKHGVCINDINKFSCSCSPNYTVCETEVPDPVRSESEFWLLVISCVVGAAVLAAAAACCWWCFLGAAAKRRKREKKVQPRPHLNKHGMEGIHTNPESPMVNNHPTERRLSSVPKLPPLSSDIIRQRKLSRDLLQDNWVNPNNLSERVQELNSKPTSQLNSVVDW